MPTDALFWHRLQFAFTITFHYLFPQLTMGLALLIVVLKALGPAHRRRALRTRGALLGRIFGINFAIGVVTGIPMEFQFGTNWARFSRCAGGVIGQTLAMEGMFAFFLESTFLGLFLFGEKRLGRAGHFGWRAGAVRSARGSPATSSSRTNAWMQHPVGHAVAADGILRLASFCGAPAQPLGVRCSTPTP